MTKAWFLLILFFLFSRELASSQLCLKTSKFCSVYPRFKTLCAFKKNPPAVSGRSRGSSALGDVQAVSVYGPMRSSSPANQNAEFVRTFENQLACFSSVCFSPQTRNYNVFKTKTRKIIQDIGCEWITVSERITWTLLYLLLYILRINNWTLLYLSEVWTRCCVRDAVQNRRLWGDANHRMWILWEMPESQEEIRWKGQYRPNCSAWLLWYFSAV